ncbi:hypothetical protein QVD99_008302 [Batrachochytrium dendrobatidis]|nr:hypothetical protein O5D80_007175 [Batrachochytrium dendrobatidis]KAK5664756.1 hypothetical protein QVD99_008302 [Batrachochytrium dendrobatidis]
MADKTALTAGEECQQAAKILSSFADPRQGAITAAFITTAMGLAVFKGDQGVAIVRLKTQEWSAPCAITWENASGTIQPGQETVLLFMTEKSIFSLVGRTPLVLNRTHVFQPGPLYGNILDLNSNTDVYAYVRYNNGFTPADLISAHMSGWSVREDPPRHGRWHGKDATWFDVLTNKITVDRSSVGNALYLVLNMAASNSGSANQSGEHKNVADLSKLLAPAATQPLQQLPGGAGSMGLPQDQIYSTQQQPSSLDPQSQALYQQLLLEQQQQQMFLLQQQQQQQQQLMMQTQQPIGMSGNSQIMFNNMQPQLLQQQQQPSMVGYGKFMPQQFMPGMPAQNLTLQQQQQYLQNNQHQINGQNAQSQLNGINPQLGQGGQAWSSHGM